MRKNMNTLYRICLLAMLALSARAFSSGNNPRQCLAAEISEQKVERGARGLHDFSLKRFEHEITEVIDGKLVLGGSVHQGRRAAMAQIDLATNNLDFTRIFSKAHVIIAVSEAPEDSPASLIALAT